MNVIVPEDAPQREEAELELWTKIEDSREREIRRVFGERPRKKKKMLFLFLSNQKENEVKRRRGQHTLWLVV